MIKQFYCMPQNQLDKYTEVKTDLITAREGLNEKEIQVAKSEVLKECKIYDIDTELEDNKGKLYSIQNNIAVINVAGMLVQKVDFCSAFFGETLTTYSYIREASLMADNDPQVKEVLYIHDSGGGVVNGCEETFQVIMNMSKFTTSAVKNMSASADYWLSSATDKIIGISKTGFYGSIGVAVELIDRSKQEKASGISRTTLTNHSSKDKRPDLMSEEGQGILINELDSIYNVFKMSILEKRSEKLTDKSIDSMAGKVFIASEALEMGLIDDIMTEADLFESLSIQNRTSPVVSGKNKTEGNTKMKLVDYLKTDPEAQADYDSQIEAAKEEGEKTAIEANAEALKKDAANVSTILKLSGAKVDDMTLKSIEARQSPEQWALAEKESALEIAKANNQDLGELKDKTEIVKGSETSKSEKTMDAAIDKVLGKNEGAK